MRMRKVVSIWALLIFSFYPSFSWAEQGVEESVEQAPEKKNNSLLRVGAFCRLRKSSKAHQQVDGKISVIPLKKGAVVEILGIADTWIEFRSNKESGSIWKKTLRQLCQPAQARDMDSFEEEKASDVSEDSLNAALEYKKPAYWARWKPWAVTSASLIVFGGALAAIGGSKGDALDDDVMVYNDQSVRSDKEYSEIKQRGKNLANLDMISLNAVLLGSTAAALSVYFYSLKDKPSSKSEAAAHVSGPKASWGWFGSPWGIFVHKKF